jgi:hypothetical protein
VVATAEDSHPDCLSQHLSPVSSSWKRIDRLKDRPTSTREIAEIVRPRWPALLSPGEVHRYFRRHGQTKVHSFPVEKKCNLGGVLNPNYLKEESTRPPDALPTDLSLTEKPKTTRKTLKISPMKTSSIISAVAALLSLAGYASAGTLTLDPGTPVFTPAEAFNPNTIVVNVIGTDLVRISGAATVTPPAENIVTVDISGSYSADAGDMASVAYFFTADLNGANPVNYTISGEVDVLGTPIPFSTSGTITNGLNEYHDEIAVGTPFPFPVSGTFSGELKLDFTAPPAASGTMDIAIQQIDIQMAPTAATLPPAAQSQNISTRGDVQTGEDILIGGFIITGTGPKQVIIRALGPSLATQVSGVLADPVLNLFDSTGAVVATNDNWKDNSADDQATIIADGLDMYNNGTGNVEINDLESVIVQTLNPGAYTAQVSGSADGTGIGLVEVYDVDTSADGTLANISTRGFVDIDQNVLIGGFIIGPDTSGADELIVRAIGPSLTAKGVTNALADPTLTVMDANANVIKANDNFVDSPDADTITADGLAPDDPDFESAVFIIPQPGEYTAIVSGVTATTTGVALVEVYNLQGGTTQ